MKAELYFINLLAIAFVSLAARAEGPPTHTPPAPPFKAAEAARLADEYVATTFPKFPDLYCSEVVYESHRMKPDKTVIWRLRYLIPNHPRREISGTSSPDWGICLVFVHANKTVSHTIEPKRNAKAEQDGAEPATAPKSKPEG